MPSRHVVDVGSSPSCHLGGNIGGRTAAGTRSPVNPFFERIVEPFADHLTLFAVAFTAAVLVMQRVMVGGNRRNPRVLLGLLAAHVLVVAIAAIAVGFIDIRTEANLLGRLLVGWVIVLGVAGFLFDVVLVRIRMTPSRIIQDLTVFGAIGVASLVILRRGGVDVTGIVATSAVITAVIGLSLQDTLGNTIGGLTLQLDDSIHTGDWIKVGDIVGKVKEVRWRFTAVETRNWETVYIPNSKLVKGDVIVLGKRSDQPEQWRRWVWFNVDFRHAPTNVMDCVTDALRAAPIKNVSADPPPNCVLMDFGESTARYAVRYWLTDLAHDDPTDSSVRVRMYFALKRAGIPLALPAHALFLTEDTNKRRERKQREAQDRRFLALKRIAVFAPLDDKELEIIAERLIFAPFSRGELITRQGAEAHWLYMIDEGTVSVRVAVNDAEQEVTTMGEGGVFGEMSLLTGETRAASVYAVDDVDCWRLDQAAFKTILMDRPEVARPIAALLAERQVQLIEVKETLDATARDRQLKEQETQLLSKMRAFFGI